MRKVWKKVFDENGIEVLKEPKILYAELIKVGMRPLQASRCELIATAFPGLASTLSKAAANGGMTEAEAQTVLSAVCRKSGLTAETVRSCLFSMLSAAGVYKSKTFPSMLRFGPPSYTKNVNIISDDEAEMFARAAQAIKQEETEAYALKDLQTLADAGNASACYECGIYFGQQGKNKEAARHFKRAAILGFGPGYMGYATFLLRQNMLFAGAADRAASQPIALAGKQGKDWLQTAKVLTVYRKNNLLRIRFCFLLCIVALMLGLVVLRLNSTWGTTCIATCSLAVCWLVFSLLYSRCTTTVPAWCLLCLSWGCALVSLL